MKSNITMYSVLALIIVVLGGGYLWCQWNQTVVPPTEDTPTGTAVAPFIENLFKRPTQTASKPVTTGNQPAKPATRASLHLDVPKFDSANVQTGDSYGAFTVTSVAAGAGTAVPTSMNIRVAFSGTSRITGTYQQADASGFVKLTNLDPVGLATLPRAVDALDGRTTVCVANPEVFGSLPYGQKVTATIQEFTYSLYPKALCLQTVRITSVP